MATERGPRFISPSSASVIVEVNPPSSLTTFANAPKSGGSSTISLRAPAGNDTFVFTLYDKPQKDGEKTPAGNPLGIATVTKKIVAGKENTVDATIAGLVANVKIAPEANQPFVEALKGGGYELVGDSPQTFRVTALDADGNVIVPQPSVSLTSPGTGSTTPTGGTQFVTVKRLAAKGSFAVNASSWDPLGEIPLALDGSAQGANGDFASGTVRIALSSAIYVGYGQSTKGATPVAVYDSAGNRIALPKGAFAGVIAPGGFAYDPVHHDVIVADTGVGSLLKFDAAGRPINTFTPVRPIGLLSAIFDTNNNVIYALGYGSNSTQLDAYTPQGSYVNLSTNYLFNTVKGSAIGYLNWLGVPNFAPGDTRISVGSSTSGEIDTYREDGTYEESVTAPLSTTTGITGFPLLDGAMIAVGTPASPSGPDVSIQFFEFGNAIATATAPDPTCVNYDLNTENILIGSGSKNAVIPASTSDVSGVAITVGKPLIKTPASSGLSEPQAIGVSY